MKRVLSRAGQSTLEYVIVLTAIVTAILLAASQFIKPSVNKVYGEASSALNTSSSYFARSAGGGINMGGGTTGDTTGGTTGDTTGGTTGDTTGELIRH